MSEAITKIVRLEREVMTRKRLLSLRDWLTLSVSGSSLLLAIIVGIGRLRSISLPQWPIIVAVLSLAILVALIRWFFTGANESHAAFLIDQALKLDDRIASSRLIIQRGGPTTALEEALIEDAAERLGAQRAASLVPLEMRRWHALSLVSVLGLVAALMIPARSVPVNHALAEERADIESAGEHLEQTAAEVQQSAAPGTETATLANEQAELGRAFRRSTATRSEALRRLTALEERIRKRHDELANTRADEIVSLADRQFDSALSTASKPRRPETEDDASNQASPADERSGQSNKAPNKNRPATASGDNAKSAESSQNNPGKFEKDRLPNQASLKGAQRNAEKENSALKKQTEPQKRPQEPIPGNGNRPDSHVKDQSDLSKAGRAAVKPETPLDQKSSEQKANDQRPSVKNPSDPSKGDSSKDDGQKMEEQTAGDQKANEMPAGSPDLLKAVPDSLAEQAAKALPKLSAELLKKAAEMRANQLTHTDIEKLRRAAESLSRDLSQIEQSKELQKVLQEMARQIRPEQIEQVARELGNQENIKQELEAAARLLSQNQRGKEIVAGLAEQVAQSQEQSRREDQRGDGKSNMRRSATGGRDQASRSNQANGFAGQAKATADGRIEGQGRQATLKGKLQQGAAGQYLFLQSRAGDGAARAPYSSVYPQYRREAERSVQRSQVPPNLRSVVRKYFDAINPDAKR